jgi:hypothetical protein
MPPRITAIPETHSVADTGVTLVSIMTGTPMTNIHPATHPLTINLPDGKVVKSTHVCDMLILGLPTVLVGHVIPNLQVASLLGIRILCKAGCIVVFSDTACYVKYKGRVILTGTKDPSTDLWTLPITPTAITQNTYQGGRWTAPGKSLPQASPCLACAPRPPLILLPPDDTTLPQPAVLATFTHSMRTCANAVKFAHQSLCNPKISANPTGFPQRVS